MKTSTMTIQNNTWCITNLLGRIGAIEHGVRFLEILSSQLIGIIMDARGKVGMIGRIHGLAER